MDFKLILNNSINLDEAIQQKKLTWFKNKSHAWFDKNKETKNEKVNGKFSILFCSIFSLWNKMLVVEREKKKKNLSWLFAVCFFFVIISYLHGWWMFWSYILYLLEIFYASRIWYYFVVNEISWLLIIWARLWEKVFYVNLFRKRGKINPKLRLNY